MDIIIKRILRFKDVQKLIPFSRSYIYNLISQGRFPAQIIAKFKKIRVDEDFLYSKQSAEWDAKLKEAESSARTNKESPEWARWIADNLLGLVFMGAMTLFLVDCAYNGNVSDQCSPLGLESNWNGKSCS